MTPDPAAHVSLGEYLIGCAGMLTIALALAAGATRLRARYVPGWTGAPARLAEAVIAIGLLVLILELLGIVGLLNGAAIAIASALIGGGVAFGLGRVAGGPPEDHRGRPSDESLEESGARSRSEGGPPAAPNLLLAVGIVVSLLLFAQWAMPSLQALDRGIYGGDSLWYHMPFAARFAESGSITALQFTDPLYLNWFYPQNSELLHSAGLALFENDFLSPLINLGWLGIALLAAWCIGRPYGAGAISLTGVAILLAADLMFSRQPGNANNDVVGLALFLAAIALLVRGAAGGGPEDHRERPSDGALDHSGARSRSEGPLPAAALAVAGLAAGLALGTKLTFVVPVAALTVGVIVIAGRGGRRAASLAWGIPMLLGGGFWYLRNLIAAGNPLPWAKLGVGPLALPRSEELDGRDPFSIADYATDGGVWRHYFFPGLNERFGELWPALLALAALGVVLALIRGGRIERLLAAVAVVTAIAYVLTPLSASGPEGAPLGFRLNLRYLAPALAIGLTLLAFPSARMPGRARASAVGIFALLLAILLAGHSPLAALDDGHLAGALVIAAIAATAIGLAVTGVRGAPRAALVAAGAAAVVAIAVLGWPQQQDYEEFRYARDAPDYPPPDEHPGTELAAGLGAAFEWARGTRDEQIGIGGTTAAFFQYGLYGPDSSNRVRYVGERGPRGSFDEIEDCRRWRTSINEGGYRFIVTTPDYDQDRPERPLPSSTTEWTASDPAAVPVLREGSVSVFRLEGKLDPAACP